MEPVTWGFLGTLLGTVVGASASIATTIINARNSRKIQQDAKSQERLDRANDFQRVNLLELQEALASGLRLIGRAHIEDVESFRKNQSQDKLPLLSEDLDQEILASSRSLAILTERITDQKLRETVKKLRSQMTDVLMARNERESLSALKISSATFDKAMEELGTVLRSTY